MQCSIATKMNDFFHPPITLGVNTHRTTAQPQVMTSKDLLLSDTGKTDLFCLLTALSYIHVLPVLASLRAAFFKFTALLGAQLPIEFYFVYLAALFRARAKNLEFCLNSHYHLHNHVPPFLCPLLLCILLFF